MKFAVVTGSTGFIGSNLVEELLRNRYFVYAVVRKNSKNLGRLKTDLKNLAIIECDMENMEALALKIPPLQNGIFYHIAWEGVTGEAHKAYETQMQNVRNSISAIRVASQIGCTRFIGAGSIHEVECKVEMERNEEVSNFGNVYKTAKLMAHYYCKLEASQLGIEFIWPRITNTYGPGENSSRLVNTLIRNLLENKNMALTEAKQLYDFIYISDLANAFRLIGERGRSFQGYVLGSGRIIALRDYLEIVKNQINENTVLEYGKAQFKGVYLEKSELCSMQLRKDTLFEPRVSFEEGILKTIESIKSDYRSLL